MNVYSVRVNCMTIFLVKLYAFLCLESNKENRQFDIVRFHTILNIDMFVLFIYMYKFENGKKDRKKIVTKN